LEAEPRLNGKFRFDGQGIEVFINDRLLAPNNAPTREAFDADFRIFFGKLFCEEEYSISYSTDPRSLFTAFVKTARPFSVEELLKALA
jgi:hypothetical protein